LKKEIIVSEADFKILEDKAAKWERYKNEYFHHVTFEFKQYRGDDYGNYGFDDYNYFNVIGDYGLPEEFASKVDAAQTEIKQIIEDSRVSDLLFKTECDRLKKESMEAKQELNKIPKWIRKIFL